MKWRNGHVGDQWYRVEVYRGKKHGIKYTVAPCFGGRWYVWADRPDGSSHNSLLDAHGGQHFATQWHAQTFAETWLQ